MSQEYSECNKDFIISDIISFSLNSVELNLDSNGIDNNNENTGESTVSKNNKKANFPNKKYIMKGFLKNKREKTGKHTKKYWDNIKRKLFGKLPKILVDFFNSKHNIQDKSKQIKDIRFSDKKYFNNAKLKILLNTQLKNILNGDIRKNYRKFKQEHNSELIKEYEKSSNEEIISFFNCELIDCIKYFRKDDDIIYNDHFSFLKGLEEYYDELVKLNEEIKNDNHKKYLEFIICLINIIENKLGKYSTKENYEMDN
jgi:hypothetical protein